MASVLNQMMAAMQKLRENGLWREALAEYAHSRRGGYEGFFQGGLLWAFNSADPKTFLADVERGFPPFSGNKRVDFIIFEKNAKNDWWDSYNNGRPRRMLGMARALIELKVCRDENAAYYAAEDVKKLAGIRYSDENAELGVADKEYLVLLLLGGVGKADEMKRKIEQAERDFWPAIGIFHKGQCMDIPPTDNAVWILEGEPVPSSPEEQGFIKAMLLDVRSWLQCMWMPPE